MHEQSATTPVEGRKLCEVWNKNIAGGAQGVRTCVDITTLKQIKQRFSARFPATADRFNNPSRSGAAMIAPSPSDSCARVRAVRKRVLPVGKVHRSW